VSIVDVQLLMMQVAEHNILHTWMN